VKDAVVLNEYQEQEMSEGKKEEPNWVREDNLTQIETLLISQARAKSLSMREEPKFAANKKVSLFATGGPLKGTAFQITKLKL
jgi:hypothetical protein